MLASFAAALALPSTASAAAIDPCGSPPATTSPCSSYTILNARGTFEPQDESVGFITMNSNILDERNGGKIYNVVYPADVDQNSTSGTQDLVDQVGKLLSQDASECLILEGYSQGASVVVDALRQLTGSSFDAVKGVFLIGDPRHKPGLACNVDMQGGNRTKDAAGLFYDDARVIPEDWISKTLDVCNVEDFVCDINSGNGTDIWAGHLAYPGDAGLQGMGTKFVLKQLG